jgi:hypothetical protein
LENFVYVSGPQKTLFWPHPITYKGPKKNPKKVPFSSAFRECPAAPAQDKIFKMRFSQSNLDGFVIHFPPVRRTNPHLTYPRLLHAPRDSTAPPTPIATVERSDRFRERCPNSPFPYVRGVQRNLMPLLLDEPESTDSEPSRAYCSDKPPCLVPLTRGFPDPVSDDEACYSSDSSYNWLPPLSPLDPMPIECIVIDSSSEEEEELY